MLLKIIKDINLPQVLDQVVIAGHICKIHSKTWRKEENGQTLPLLALEAIRAKAPPSGGLLPGQPTRVSQGGIARPAVLPGLGCHLPKVAARP